MRTASVTIGMLLVVGAAVALVNCGDDDSSPTGGTGATGGSGGAGATGGSGGSKGGSGGSAGATAGSAGTGGAGDSGTPDTASGGSSGAGGSGKGGGAGTAGGGGKAGSSAAGGSSGAGGSSDAGGGSGAAGAAGSAGKDGGTGDSADASSDAGVCPAMQPASNTDCAVEADCMYGATICTCVDPGPDGRWACSGDHDGGHGGEDSGATCPADDPSGTSCPDAGLPIGPCRYGNTTCNCAPGDVDWVCIRFRPQTSDRPMR